ncbi:hypothetical protein DFH11DRAFT_1176987 [Phellopilus nigrolimitatus]|nr:hypothetical protein DFH11DRAFT_1176987 [Phellopilus nigrolimitatus]
MSLSLSRSLSLNGADTRSFPDDLILAIFKDVIADDIYNESGWTGMALVILATVCRSWRFVAFSNHHLWSSMRARMHRDHAMNSSLCLARTITMHAIRSVTLPLDLDIELYESSPIVVGAVSVSGLITLLRVLLHYQKRLRSVRTVIEYFPRPTPLLFNRGFHIKDVPLLENLELIIPKPGGPYRNKHNIIFQLANAPLLKVLRVSGNVLIIPPNGIQHNLTTLNVEAWKGHFTPSITLVGLLDIVRLSPALELLHAGVCHSNVPQHYTFQSVCHAKLSSLRLFYRAHDGVSYFSTALDHLTLPALRSLAIGFMETSNMEFSHVPYFLHRSISLGANVVHLELHCVSLDDARQCLPLVPNLTNIAICGPLDEITLSEEETLPLIRDLILHGSHLCPELEDIEIQSMALDVNAVVDLIVTRWRPHTGHRHLKEMYLDCCLMAHAALDYYPEVSSCVKEGFNLLLGDPPETPVEGDQNVEGEVMEDVVNGDGGQE